MLLAIETIDLNGSESMFSISQKLNLQDLLSSKVKIWKLRCSNPMRKSFVKNSINFNEFIALVKVTSEMARYLHPYIREILSSRDNYIQRPELWDNFSERYSDLISERFNSESVRVRKLTDKKTSQSTFTKVLLNLALCNSTNSHKRLQEILINL